MIEGTKIRKQKKENCTKSVQEEQILEIKTPATY